MTETAKTDQNEIVLILAADNNYAMQLAVTLCSIVDNLASTRTLSIFVLDGGIAEKNKTRIIRSIKNYRGRIQWLQSPLHLLNWAKPVRHLPIAAYLRLLITKVLPPEVKKAIYLDCDLIVLKDLGELWDINIGEAHLLAAQDSRAPYVSSRLALSNYLELGLPENARYFNSGVMVIDVEKWRQSEILEISKDYFEKYQNSIRWADQDILNGLLSGQWQELSPNWNFQLNLFLYPSWQESPYSEETYTHLVNDPYIIHYCSPVKPWNGATNSAIGDQLYLKYLLKTEWRGQFFSIAYKHLRDRIHKYGPLTRIRKFLKVGTRLKQFKSWLTQKP